MPSINLQDLDTKDLTNPALQRVLAVLQGNILKGHGRDHAIYLFVRLVADSATSRKAVKALAQQITTAAAQYDEARDYRQHKICGSLFMNVLLTARGYQALDFDQATIEQAFPEPEETNFGTKARFKAGMRETLAELGDPPTDQWEAPYQDDIHLLIIMADDDEAHLQRQARAMINFVRSVGVVIGVEQGGALRDAAGRGVEHFGYADGRSQPVYLEAELATEVPLEPWNPLESLTSVLVPDGLATQDPNAFGSYYVFRKLEQDVPGFKRREAELGALLGGNSDLAGALAVGRFRDGTPVVQASQPMGAPMPPNNFTFDGKQSERCPFHAHIRKVNPRGDLSKDPNVERPRRIARRGIPYGDRGDASVGLLFACFQASIANQFAFLQAHWANNPNFAPNAGKPGQDPIVSNAVANPSPQRWPAVWGHPGQEKEFEFGHFVRMKGGEFFFAPSLSFFSTL